LGIPIWRTGSRAAKCSVWHSIRTPGHSAIYGKGIRPHTPEEAAGEAAKYKNDRALLGARAQAALAVLAKHELTDPKRIAAIGYCFGGTTVLELARSGAEIAGVVSFHGGLSTPDPTEPKKIRAKVLVLHGADDPNVPPQEVAAFEEEMRQAGVDWQLIAYGGAVHAFTDWSAGSDNSKGAAYNERADRRSWEAMNPWLLFNPTNAGAMWNNDHQPHPEFWPSF